MSEKTVKRNRKKAKQVGTPIAGCPVCGEAKWHIAFDAFPPLQTKIIAFICARENPPCGHISEVEIDLHHARGHVPVEEGT